MGKAIEVSASPIVNDSVKHILTQIECGETLAAADHLIVCGAKEELSAIIEELMRQLPTFIKSHPGKEELVYTALTRIGLNLVGYEAEIAGWSKGNVEKALSMLGDGSRRLEASTSDRATGAIARYLDDMSSVNAGDSLTALMAERIKKRVVTDRGFLGFINSYASVAKEIFYRQIVEKRYGKFGNDYARGLETLRHLGFSQVSTNPVLAAKAFDEDPSLVKKLESEIAKNPEWKQDAAAHGHEIVVAGTLLALWTNLEVFRPLAILAENMDYMISFQLNPNVADDFERSMEDARRVYELARTHLTEYDRFLGVNDPGRLPPNIVFKVAGSSPTARHITKELNAAGIGTNNTVTFTVVQETRLIADALEGKVEAIKAGRPVTRTYETNMGGRLVSHLREEEAKRILLEVASRRGDQEANGIILRIGRKLNLSAADTQRVTGPLSIAEKADIVCAYKYMKSLTHEALTEAALATGLTETQVQQLEMDLKKAGTLVTKRVYSTFYEQRNRQKWIEWLRRKHNISSDEANLALDSMDVLPASKRVPEDTLDTIAKTNMCNTEFPNHAKAVQLYCEKPDFDFEKYREAVLQPIDAALLKRLSKVRDFTRAYEYTAEVQQLLIEVGVADSIAEPSLGGVNEDEWQEFGPVRKTMNEFKDAYNKFLERCIQLGSS